MSMLVGLWHFFVPIMFRQTFANAAARLRIAEPNGSESLAAAKKQRKNYPICDLRLPCRSGVSKRPYGARRAQRRDAGHEREPPADAAASAQEPTAD